MVLGLRSKHRKGASVQVDYLIHVQAIKPWPPSQSLVSVQSILVQWENGDHKNSGSFISNVGDGKVEFSESFRLQVTLCREASKRGASSDNFQKNCLEFNLYEPRKDKASKGQLLGSAVINLAEYGIIKDAITIGTPINFKKSSKSTAHLYVNVQHFDREHLSLSKEVSLDNDVSESVSEVTNEGNDEEIEIASFTDDEDDDASSNTSRNMSSLASESNWVSPGQSNKNGSESALAKSDTRRANDEPVISSGVASSNAVINSSAEAVKHLNGSSRPPSSRNVSSNQHNLVKDHVAEVGLSDDLIAMGKTSSNAHFEEPQATQEGDKKAWGHKKTGLQDGPASNNLHVGPMQEKVNEDRQGNGLAGDFLEVKKHALEETLFGALPHDAMTNQAKLRSNTMAINREAAGVQATTRKDKLKHLKSVQLQFDSSENDGTFTASQFSERAKKFDVGASVHKGSKLDDLNRRKQITNSFVDKKSELTSDAEMLGEEVSETYCSEVGLSSMVGEHKKTSNKVQLMEKKIEIDLLKPVHEDGLSYPSNEREETKSNCSGNNAELKSKVEMLEEELMETAAIEIGLYSVVAEHGSSISKVHASARRLARFYLHACKAKTARSQALQASAARSIISGLVLVSKACGNDVPRLTFWLSNTIMLRTIVTQAVQNLHPTAAPSANDCGDSKKLCQPSPYQEVKTNKTGSSDEWEDPQTYIMAIEKVEAWIFSRIVESIWWQTLTPHMQSTAIKNSSSKKTHAKRYGLGDVEQGNFAIDLWKKAFKDACERLCPIRAGGHECGCLHVPARLVMEQLVGRLDVAMFNAILRESAEDMPTDPVSDPISDPMVLPIPAGKSSFGAGARLKNAVGNWSRWLTDLFGIDDNDSPEDNDELDNSKIEWETSFKSFHLLKALSDLMMLPFEMLADKSTRQEVCPTLAAPLIKRVLNNFVPDEFNPDPIPESILEALDSEDPIEVREESITSFPFIAAPTIYSPPPTSSLVKLLREVGSQSLQRSGSALLRKSYTSDDELDELDSPMTTIIIDNSRSTPVSPTSTWMPNMKAGRKVVRYQLLREVWKNGE